jgi:hypothetical protein
LYSHHTNVEPIGVRERAVRSTIGVQPLHKGRC